MPEVRLIDANAFSEQYGNYYAEQGPEEGFIGTVGDLISKQPTIEAEPVRHGRCDDSADGITPYCTVCGRTHGCFNRTPDFCPHCGARMDATDTNVGGKGGADNGFD